jgi:hypothetical protein
VLEADFSDMKFRNLIEELGAELIPHSFSLMFLCEWSKFLVCLCTTWLPVKPVCATCISNLRIKG